jgi:hypothetical protein
VTLRTDRPVEAQLEDLRALLDRRIGLLTTRETHPPLVAAPPNGLDVAAVHEPRGRAGLAPKALQAYGAGEAEFAIT